MNNFTTKCEFHKVTVEREKEREREKEYREGEKEKGEKRENRGNTMPYTHYLYLYFELVNHLVSFCSVKIHHDQLAFSSSKF